MYGTPFRIIIHNIPLFNKNPYKATNRVYPRKKILLINFVCWETRVAKMSNLNQIDTQGEACKNYFTYKYFIMVLLSSAP